MGETSAKRMRGSEMDDVIFAGTANRPSRNIADVTLVLDNSQRKAPAVFNEFDEIEVVRRIEPGAGSVYRVNGKEEREIGRAHDRTPVTNAQLVCRCRLEKT